MLPPPVIKNISTILDIDYEKLFRGALTNSPSADEQLRSQIDILKKKLRILQKIDTHYLGSQTASELQGPLESLPKLLVDHAERDNKKFVERHDAFRKDFAGTYNEFTKYWPAITSAAVEQSGLLQIEYQQFVDDLKKQAADVQTKISQMIENAQQIEVRARETAAGISIREAQKQFEAAKQKMGGRFLCGHLLVVCSWRLSEYLPITSIMITVFQIFLNGRSFIILSFVS